MIGVILYFINFKKESINKIKIILIDKIYKLDNLVAEE
jgi:septin family protein